jgi:hypothetical protein
MRKAILSFFLLCHQIGNGTDASLTPHCRGRTTWRRSIGARRRSEPMQLGLLATERVRAIQEELAGFLLEEVIAPTREYHRQYNFGES